MSDQRTFDLARAGPPDRCVEDGAAFSLSAADVKQDVRLVGGGEDEAVIGNPGRGGQLGVHAIILELHRVVAGFGGFVGLVKPRAITFIRMFQTTGNGLQRPCRRHQRDTTDLEFTKADEALDRFVATIVTDRLPAILVAVVRVRAGTGTRHAERNGPRGEEEPAGMGGPDARVDGFQWAGRFRQSDRGIECN